jgi:hypothetical protein
MSQLQDLIDEALANGWGEVEVPAGTHLLDRGLVIPAGDRSLPVGMEPGLTLWGQGRGSTIVYTNTPNIDLLTCSRSNVAILGMRMQGSQQREGTGRGIVISDPVNGRVLSNIRLADLYVCATEREALCIPDGFPHLLGQPAYDRIAIECSYDRVTFAANGGGDLVYIGAWNTHHRFTQCASTDFRGRALFLNGADSTSCRDCVFEAGDNTKPYVEGRGAISTLLDHCRYEDHATTGPFAVFTAHDRASKGWVDRDPIPRRAVP